MNKLWGFLTSGFVVLIAAISFSPVNQAAAKIKFTDNFSIYKNEPENAKPSVYWNQTTINAHGTLIYDADTFPQKNVVEAAADHWNQAVGMQMVMSYQQAGVAKSDADVVIKASSDLPAGTGGVTGFNGVIYEGQQNLIQIATGVLDKTSTHTGFIQAVSTTSHEMGHALGLNHDPGPLMGTSGGPDLDKGILPGSPAYNVNAIGDLLENLDELYSGAKPVKIPNMTGSIAYRDAGTTTNILASDPIAQEKFDGHTMLARHFTGGKVEIHINQNVYQVGRGWVGTTASLNLVNTQQPIVTNYDASEGQHYYQIKVGSQYYIIWQGYTTVVGDAYRDAGTATTISDSEPVSHLYTGGSRLVTRDFTDRTIEITGNENVHQVSGGLVGTTDSFNLIGTKQKVVTTYTSLDGQHFYQIHVGDKYFFISSQETKIVSEG